MLQCFDSEAQMVPGAYDYKALEYFRHQRFEAVASWWCILIKKKNMQKTTVYMMFSYDALKRKIYDWTVLSGYSDTYKLHWSRAIMIRSNKILLVEIKIIEIFSSFLHREVVDSGKEEYIRKRKCRSRKEELDHSHLLQK